MKTVLSIVTALYFALVFVHLCAPSPWRNVIVQPMEMFWNFWRLDQNWALFSPNIREINYHTVAIVTFDDGSRMAWEPPRVNKRSMSERFRDEKWRKWASDSLPWPDYKQFWPDFARYVGRQFYSPINKPVSLSLNLWWIEIPPAESNSSQINLPYHTKQSCVFEYTFKPEDFK